MSLASERDLVRISPEPISQEEVTEFVTDPSIGGISLFIGESSERSFLHNVLISFSTGVY